MCHQVKETKRQEEQRNLLELFVCCQLLPQRYLPEVWRTLKGQTAKPPLDIEAALRGRAGVDSCCTLIHI